MKHVAIVGGGLVGSLLTVFLARRGIKVDVYERRSDMRKAQTDVGRSINLVVSHRGWTALKKAGLEEEVKKITVPVYARMTHDLEGRQTRIPYSIHNEAIWSVSRGGLNALLLNVAETLPGVTLHFNHKCSDVSLDDGTATFTTEKGETINAQADLLIGADGAFSAVRHAMMRKDRFNYAIDYIEHGYKELVIPAHADGSYQLDKNCSHIWPRKEFMLMALANLDGSFTCTLFLPYDGENSFDKLQSKQEVEDFFKKLFPDALRLMPSLASDFFANKTSSLAIVRCHPWIHSDKIALIGDAAHAIVPFYGEGMNCGFEDCFVFDSLLEEMSHSSTEDLLKKYQSLRKPNGDAIAELSLRNFIEMRHLVAEPDFILRKKIEARMQEKYPEKWLPLYAQVKFTDIAYSTALQTGKLHDRLMNEIMQQPGIAHKWDSPEVEQQLLNMLEQAK